MCGVCKRELDFVGAGPLESKASSAGGWYGGTKNGVDTCRK